MDTWSVTWTTLPHRITTAGRARLSLVPSLRVSADTGQLGDTPVHGWPTLVAGLTGVRFEVRGGRPVEGTIVSEKPRQDLWNALFAVTTPVDVDPSGPETSVLAQAETAVHVRPAVESLRAIYAGVLAESATGVLPTEHVAWDAVRGLAAWSFTKSGVRLGTAPSRDVRGGATTDGSRRAALAPRLNPLLTSPGRTAADVAAAAEILRTEGEAAAAAALPLALVQQRLRYGGRSESAITPPKPSLVASIRPVHSADFHQVVGLIGDHPTLALALGLRVDVEIDAFEGDRFLRLVVDDAPPLQGPTRTRPPWSAVRCEPGARRFVMRPDPSLDREEIEVRNGMLDLSPANSARYVVTTTDLYAAAQQLQALSSLVIGPEPPPSVGLPPQRNSGLVVAQTDRRGGTFRRALTRADQLHAAVAAQSDDVILFADDVTSGYRVDVADGDRPFRSLMRRQITYRVGSIPSRPNVIPATDEGVVEPMTLAEQYDDGVPHLLLGEELFGWDGASLVAPMPGRRLAGEPGGPALEDPQPPMAPGYPLALDVVAEPRTLPRLRFGRRYRIRVRAVDPAGNSIDPDTCDPALVSDTIPYHRVDPVLTPTMTPRRAFTFGESRDRLVVRSDGAGTIIGDPCERHLLAPKSTQRLAETHGMFDAAFGPGATAAERARQLAIASHESGQLTDVRVPRPNEPTTTMTQPGVRVAVNDGTAPGPVSTLPLTPGQTLRAGEYVVLDTAEPVLPWLADPAAAGVAVIGPAGSVTAPYGSTGSPSTVNRWPDVRPARLVAAAGPDASIRAKTGPDGRGVVEVTVPAASEHRLQLSSTLRPDVLDCFDLASPRLRQLAQDGQIGPLTPSGELVVVHAVSTPMLPLTLSGRATTRAAGQTTAELIGALHCHSASTIQIDIEATWNEPVDDMTSDFREVPRSSTAEHVEIKPGEDDRGWRAQLTLGDTRRRDLTLRPVASSRFREYFRAEDLRTRTGDGVTTIVSNAARPSPPRVHSVLPTFRWTREVVGGNVYVGTRRTAGVRVWLERPWMETGPGERLGVVLFADRTSGASAVNGRRRIAELATRFFADPLQGGILASPPPDQTTVTNPAEPVRIFNPVELGNQLDGLAVAGVEVSFDTERKLWFADIDISELQVPSHASFLRLGLVRYQPESITGCHISRVVVPDLVQLMPTRTLRISPVGDATGIRVSVQGPHVSTSVQHRATITRRASNLDGLAVVQSLTSPPVADFVLGGPPPNDDTQTLARSDIPLPADLSGLDLVVREEWQGDYLHREELVSRTTWLDLVPGDLLKTLLGISQP